MAAQGRLLPAELRQLQSVHALHWLEGQKGPSAGRRWSQGAGGDDAGEGSGKPGASGGGAPRARAAARVARPYGLRLEGTTLKGPSCSLRCARHDAPPLQSRAPGCSRDVGSLRRGSHGRRARQRKRAGPCSWAEHCGGGCSCCPLDSKRRWERRQGQSVPAGLGR